MKTLIHQILLWVLILCRVAVGAVVVHTGYSLVQGNGPFAHWDSGSNLSGIFIMAIGAYFIFSSLLPQLFDRSR